MARETLIEELRTTGVAVKLISDGDIAGVIHAVNTEDTGIDIYLGSGGAPEHRDPTGAAWNEGGSQGGTPQGEQGAGEVT